MRQNTQCWAFILPIFPGLPKQQFHCERVAFASNGCAIFKVNIPKLKKKHILKQ